jgi:hypothetical protein
MVTVEMLTISAIFLSGFYIGYKLKTLIMKIKTYLDNRKVF